MTLENIVSLSSEIRTEIGKGIKEPRVYKPMLAASLGIPAAYSIFYSVPLITCVAMAGVIGLFMFGLYGAVTAFKTFYNRI